MSENQLDSEDLKEYYSIPLEEIYDDFSVESIEMGLSDEQAAASIELNGRNILQKGKKSIWHVVIAPIINLLIIIYLIAAILMAALGEVTRTVPTFVILTFNALVAIFNQLKAEKQLKALSALSAARSIVIRNGEEVELLSGEMTLGDVVKFNQGDKISADLRIIKAVNLSVNESSLTGESEPVKKQYGSDSLLGENLPLQDQNNMLFLGTFVASGSCIAIVVKIGPNTEIGKINSMLEDFSTGEIPLRKKMNNFAKLLGIGVLALLTMAIIFKTVTLFASFAPEIPPWEFFRKELVDSIDLAMKVMPINLPLLTTIVLLTGVLVMAGKGVVVKEISRTESLGRVSVVCSDKTGTLTKNEMTVVAIWTPDMEYGVTGIGYNPSGAIKRMGVERFTSKQKNVQLEKLIISSYLNNNAVIKKETVKTALKDEKGSRQEVFTVLGLPTEGALKVMGKKYDSAIEQKIKPYDYVYEFAFDSSIKRMSKVFQIAGIHQLFAKGATEFILPLCSNYEDKSGFHYLAQDMRKIIMDEMQEFAADGYRVLTICSRDLKTLPKSWDGDDIRKDFETDLTFLGLVVIFDPPRDDVKKAVEECKDAGISVIMITGDSITTGKAIGEKIGIFEEGKHIAVEGKNIESISDEEFPLVTVYGRVSPEHKQIIVKRYQDMGKIVTMTGDGVNDALALSLADCGLAMGIQGTEVAKEAADMVITDDSFSTIIHGIEEGRGLFKKIRTIVYFFICISVMEAMILFSSIFIMDTNFFDFWQLNLLYITAHSFPSLGFTVMAHSKKNMEEKPRDSAEIIDRDLFRLMLFHIALMGISILIAYTICMSGYPISSINELGTTGYSDLNEDIISAAQSKARTMAFVVLFLLESVVMPFQIRRMNQPIRESVKDMDWIHEFPFYLVAISVLIFLIYAVPIQNFLAGIEWNLYFMYLDPLDWLIVLLLCLPSLIGFEIIRNKFNMFQQPETEDSEDEVKVDEVGTIPETKVAPKISYNVAEEALIKLLDEKGNTSKRAIINFLIELGVSQQETLASLESLKNAQVIKYFRKKPTGYGIIKE